MKITSRKVSVQKSAMTLCDFLTNVKNFEQLMPENISKFEVIKENAFVFALKGMPEIALEVIEVVTPNKIVLGAIDKKLPFTLTGDINAVSETNSKIDLVFQGNFNSMMAMMIKGPITKFLENLVSNMENLNRAV